MTRKEVLPVRFSREEKAALAVAAEVADRKMSAMVRMITVERLKQNGFLVERGAISK